MFFIATANQLGPIPTPLRDRMEIIQLAGYSDREKLNIAKQYLIPRQIKENGLTPEQLEITDDAINLLTARYTREAGVRQLERTIGNLARKVALKVAQGETEKVTITPRTSKSYLGAPRFYPEEARKELPAGVATGMAWTEMGGEVLFIEATLLPGGGGLTLTGQLGEVMKESAQAARSYLWSHAAEFGIDPEVIKAKRRSPARSGGRDSERRPERGRDDGFGSGVALHRPKSSLRYGDDRRDHAFGAGVSRSAESRKKFWPRIAPESGGSSCRNRTKPTSKRFRKTFARNWRSFP